jgi:hypothetical protein
MEVLVVLVAVVLLNLTEELELAAKVTMVETVILLLVTLAEVAVELLP